MKRMLSIGFVLAAALAACFGAGPTPTQPAGATVVYAAPLPSADNQCNGSAVYIGDVAIGAELGYATLIPYQPNNCNGGGSPPNTVMSIVSFATSGGNAMGTPVEGSTMTTSWRPRVATNGSAYASLYSFGGTDQLGGVISPPIQLMAGSSALGGNLEGLVLDGAAMYFASDNQSGGTVADVGAPSFPCCGPANNGGQASIWTLPLPPVVSAGNATPTMVGSGVIFAGTEMKSAMVASPSHLYYMTVADSPGSVAVIVSVDKSDLSTAMIDTLSSSLANQITPVGLDANETYVAWTAAVNATTTNHVPGGCWVFTHSLSAMTTKPVLQTTNFSCLDTALDGDGTVYFTIVSNPSNNNDNNSGGNQQPFHTDGIGRVTYDGTFESIALGISDNASGPRRIYLDSNNLYAVDPLAIAKIAKSKLAGQHDFTP